VIGRIPIMDVTPRVECGRLPAKGTEHESFPVQATIFREGHDAFAAEADLIDPEGAVVQSAPMELVRPGLGRYEAWLTPTRPGSWRVRGGARARALAPPPVPAWWRGASRLTPPCPRSGAPSER